MRRNNMRFTFDSGQCFVNRILSQMTSAITSKKTNGFRIKASAKDICSGVITANFKG